MTIPPHQSDPEAPVIRRFLLESRLPDAFLLVVAAIALGLGVTFLAFSGLYQAVVSFQLTFRAVPPWAWALGLIVPAVWICSATAGDRRSAFWPCQALAAVFVGLGVSILPTVIQGAGIPSGIIMYAGVGLLCSLSGTLAHVWDSLPRDPR